MDKKTTAIVGYIGWIGFLIALLAGTKDDEFAKHHLNQSLICCIVSIIPLGITQVAATIFAIMGIVSAAQDSMEPLPLIGQWKLMK